MGTWSSMPPFFIEDGKFRTHENREIQNIGLLKAYTKL